MNIDALKNIHAGKTAWIVGRGPSLKNLSASDIGNGFVIAINQAIAQVDALSLSIPVYSIYAFGCEVYDKEIKIKPHKCVNEVVIPKDAPIIINDGEDEGGNCLLNYPKRYGYIMERDFGCSHLLASGGTSILIAKHLGASNIKMLCFDAYTDMDLRAIDENGHIQKTDAAYIGQRRQIEWAIGTAGIPVDFVKLGAVLENTDDGVLIGTPIHGNQTVVNFTDSLAVTFGGFCKAGIPIHFMPIFDSCFVDAARNYIFTMFLESPFKKLFFVDSDIGWEFRDFLEMYLLDVDFVGALYPKRNQWDEYAGYITEPKVERNGLLKATSLPTGFLCLSKQACKQVVKKYPEYYRRDGRSIYDVFRMERENFTMVGEDYSFCKKYAATGGEMWVYPNCNLSHFGSKAYTGNYREHLGNPPLDKMFDDSGSDKGNSAHQYGRFYEKQLGRFNGNKIKLLEIGLSIKGNGTQSINVWKKYFKNVDVVGYDIVDLKSFSREGVEILQGNQADINDLKQLEKYGNFDIIIDDGSHESADQIVSFDYLYPRLNKGGVYFVEDLVKGRNDFFIEHVKKTTTGKTEMFKSLSPAHRMMSIEAL